MNSKRQLWRIFKPLHSIRWRLPLTYMLIVLLTVVFLSGALLVTLDDYYTGRERDYLLTNANLAANRIAQRASDGFTQEPGEVIARLLAFLSRTRVRILDAEHNIILDSAEADLEHMVMVFTPPSLGSGGAADITFIESGALDTVIDGVDFTYPGEGREDRPPDSDRPGWNFRVQALDAPPFGYSLDITTGSEIERSDVIVTVPIKTAGGELLGYLELSGGPAFGTDVVQSVIRQLLISALLVIPLAIVVGWRISRSLSHPVITLNAAAQQMAAGDLSARVELDRPDELGTLAATFNTMAGNVEQTVVTLKQFAADAAHEIMTPITAMRTNLELAEAQTGDTTLKTDLVLAQQELKRLETLTSSLMTLARLESTQHDKPARAPVDLSMLVCQIHERFASRAEQAGINLTAQNTTRAVTVCANREQLIQVMENLVGNAVKFTPEGGSVTLSLSTTPGNRVLLLVEDTGIGIPEADLPRLFARFHRGRNASAYPGSGLGLVIARTIIEDHDGTITVSSSAAGTQFIVDLPLHDIQDDTHEP